MGNKESKPAEPEPCVCRTRFCTYAPPQTTYTPIDGEKIDAVKEVNESISNFMKDRQAMYNNAARLLESAKNNASMITMSDCPDKNGVYTTISSTDKKEAFKEWRRSVNRTPIYRI